MDKSKIRRIVREELTKTDVKDIVNDKIDSKSFEDRVKDIVAKCMSNLFKELFYKDNYWQSAIKK